MSERFGIHPLNTITRKGTKCKVAIDVEGSYS